MVVANAFQGTLEMHARIFAHSRAVVKASASVVLAYAWLVLPVWIAALKSVAPAMAIATFLMCASAIRAGLVPLVVFPCHVLIQSVQVMVNVPMASANASLVGRATSVKMHLRNATQCAPSMVSAIVQLVHAHATLGGVATIAPWVCRLLQQTRTPQMPRKRLRRMR
jgi:hypothetical protein